MAISRSATMPFLTRCVTNATLLFSACSNAAWASVSDKRPSCTSRLASPLKRMRVLGVAITC